MFIIVTAAMLKIYYVATVQRRKPKYAWKLLCAELYINRQSKYSIFKPPWPIFAPFIDIEHTSNMAAWFYTQFNVSLQLMYTDYSNVILPTLFTAAMLEV